MEGQKTNRLFGKLCAGIGEGSDIVAGSTYVCITNIIRVSTLTDSYIKSSKFNSNTTGILIPEKNVEYFEVNIGDTITVISGQINISSVN